MSYLTEAFKALDALNEDTFSVSDDGIKKLAEFEDNDDLVDEITVYDADAEDTEDLEDSYVGKVIVDCNVCHSKIYKDKSDVVIDEETQNANIDEECPYCYSTDGFKVIGEVAPIEYTEVKDDSEDEEDVDKKIEESKSIKESSTLSKLVKSGYTLKEIQKFFKDETGLDMTPENSEEFKKWSARFLKSINESKSIEESLNESVEPGKYVIRSSARDANPYVAEYSRETGKHIGYLGNGGRSWVPADSKGIMTFDTYDEAVAYAEDKVKDFYEAEVFKVERPLELEESLNEAIVTDYKGSLSNILVKNQDKISKMSTKGEIVKFLDSITDEVRDKNYLETVKRNMQKKNDFGALQYIYGIILSGEGKGVTESLEENIGTDIDEYQQWVDYDMKRYGKISDQTNKEIKEAGLQVVKDKYGDYQVIAGKYDESLKESVKDVTITTDDSRTTMTSDDEGKVTLTTEPVEQHKDDEVIEPLTDETEAEIEANDGEEDIDIEDFDEESFDELGEGYFKNVYENVNSFKTSNITTEDNKVIVEGVITFDNNVKKNTSFLFESANKTKNGKYRFIGENLNVTKGNKAFSLIGNVTDKKFLSESMNYNYRTKNDIGKFIRCCGTIKRG